MTATPRQIEANRRNALLSTGPKTPEGKENSRRNALRHGLRAVVVLPDESSEEIEALRTEYIGCFSPRTRVERDLADKAFRASRHLDRVQDAVDAATARRVAESTDEFLLRRHREIVAALGAIGDRPHESRLILSRTVEGCEALLALLDHVDEQLETAEYDSDFEAHLVGALGTGYPFMDATLRRSAARFRAFKTDGGGAELEAQALVLRELIAKRIDSTRVTSEMLVDEFDAAADRARQLALWDDSREGQLRRRYHSMAYGTFWKAFKTVKEEVSTEIEPDPANEKSDRARTEVGDEEDDEDEDEDDDDLLAYDDDDLGLDEEDENEEEDDDPSPARAWPAAPQVVAPAPRVVAPTPQVVATASQVLAVRAVTTRADSAPNEPNSHLRDRPEAAPPGEFGEWFRAYQDCLSQSEPAKEEEHGATSDL